MELQQQQPTVASVINDLIKSVKPDTNQISDGYHTFGELYDHRIELYLILCRILKEYRAKFDPLVLNVWRSKTHSDGSSYEGWFILGIGTNMGEQISYHLPISRWEDAAFAEEYETAPDFDGHTSKDVLERLKTLI